jgi:hypothetical protein
MWCGSAQAHIFRRREGLYLFLVRVRSTVAASYLPTALAGKERSEKFELIPALTTWWGFLQRHADSCLDRSASAEAYQTTERERARCLIRSRNRPNKRWKDTAGYEALHAGELPLPLLFGV